MFVEFQLKYLEYKNVGLGLRENSLIKQLLIIHLPPASCWLNVPKAIWQRDVENVIPYNGKGRKWYENNKWITWVFFILLYYCHVLHWWAKPNQRLKIPSSFCALYPQVGKLGQVQSAIFFMNCKFKMIFHFLNDWNNRETISHDIKIMKLISVSINKILLKHKEGF